MAKFIVNKSEHPYDGGYVVLPVAEYAKLLQAVTSARNAVKLRRCDYLNNQPIVAEVDKQWLYELAMGKLQEQYGGVSNMLDTYELAQCADDFIVLDVTLAKKRSTIED